jgi:hypothetical protein
MGRRVQQTLPFESLQIARQVVDQVVARRMHLLPQKT